MRRVGGSCSRALQAIRSLRQQLGNSGGDVSAEQKSNFAPYGRPTAGKVQSCTVKVVCLSNKDATRVPCGVAEREALVEAGLGEKVTVPNISCSSQEFRDVLVASFPKLEGCGGFDLLQCKPNSKELEVISLAVSQSPKLLKSVVANGRVFIRPIQKHLQLDPDERLTLSVLVCVAVRTALSYLVLTCFLYL